MTAKYTKDQFWKLYEKLPQELKDALFDEETGNNIYEVCKRNNLGNHLEDIIELTGQVLVGLTLPQELSAEIQKLNVKKETAELIAREINRLVFYPVKPVLEQLHQMEIKIEAKIVTPAPEESKQPPKKEPEEDRGPDSYREEIE